MCVSCIVYTQPLPTFVARRHPIAFHVTTVPRFTSMLRAPVFFVLAHHLPKSKRRQRNSSVAHRRCLSPAYCCSLRFAASSTRRSQAERARRLLLRPAHPSTPHLRFPPFCTTRTGEHAMSVLRSLAAPLPASHFDDLAETGLHTSRRS